MSTTTTTYNPEEQPALERPLTSAAGSPMPAIAGVALCVLLGVAQVSLAGYQVGVGNQAIQIAFLKRLADPTLFPADAMVNQTMPLYPSYFFVAIAPLLKFMDVATLYLALQMLTIFLTFATVYWLSRSICRAHTAALAAVGLLVAGHLRALAGDTLYSEGFTHTFAALPIAVAALALGFRGRWLAAFAVTGVLFNIHALTAAYAMLMLGAGMLADWREIGAARWTKRTALCGAIAVVLAAPTLALMFKTHQNFDSSWINLMRMRSADHSFPSSWWTVGDQDIPRFALILALFVLSWSFTPVRRASAATPSAPARNPLESDDGEPQDAPVGGLTMTGVRRTSRITVLMTVAVLALFAAGYLFTEVWPVPIMIRLQPFRASRLLMLLMLVHIAYGAVSAIRSAIRGSCLGTHGEMVRLSLPARIAELIAGPAILLTLGVPQLLPMLPVTLVIAVFAALVAGHLSWRQSLAAVAALFVAVLANRQIDFPLPWIDAGVTLFPASSQIPVASLQAIGWVALGTAALAALLMALTRDRIARNILLTSTVVIGGCLGSLFFSREHAQEAAADRSGLASLGTWMQVNTAKDSLILAPKGFAGFRAESNRSLVADWRDGTQLYFCAAYGPTWIKREQDIQPGLTYSDDGHVTADGDDLDTRSDQELVELAKKYQSKDAPVYILLKTPPADQPRTLAVAHSAGGYTLYLPRFLPARPAPAGVLNSIVWNSAEDFMANTVQPNIEKNRKADVSLQVVDESGLPVQGLAVKLDQTKSPFTFGTSLGFFNPDTAKFPYADGDQIPPPVRPIELQKMPEVFNGSMIPFSGKWAFIEPYQGTYSWSDLDKYVDYCLKNDITMEFHHLTGIRPEWIAEMGGHGAARGLDFPAVIPAVQTEFNRHCLAVLDRYKDKIKYYQVVNEKYMMEYVPAAWKILKKKYPDIQFGLSDCINFYDPEGSSVIDSLIPGRQRAAVESLETKGMDSVKWLTDQGIKPDFFSIHGHHPANVWADPREMYSQINKVAALSPGMKIHISEEYLQVGGRITGPLRTGTLTPQLQAEYLVRYFTIGFSNKNVDMMNLWGGMADEGWTNTGIIDHAGNPTPAFDALKKLFTETFRSHVSAELGIDGGLESRVFHGTYQITITLADGRKAMATVVVPQQAEAKIRLRLDNANGTLEAIP